MTLCTSICRVFAECCAMKCSGVVQGCSGAFGASWTLLVLWAEQVNMVLPSCDSSKEHNPKMMLKAESNQLTFISMNQSCVFLTGILTDLTL